jgi:hypothetical protein
MPQGRTKLVKDGFVNVLVEPNDLTHVPNVTVYGPYPTEDMATDERRLLLSEMAGLSGKILQRRARMYTLPMLNWGNSQRVEKAG